MPILGNRDGRLANAAAEILERRGNPVAAGIARTIGTAVAAAADDPNVPIAPATPEVTSAVVATAEAAASDPVVVNQMNKEPWWQSRIITGLIPLVGAILWGLLTPEQQSVANEVIAALAAIWIAVGRLWPRLKPFRWFGLLDLIEQVTGKKIGV